MRQPCLNFVCKLLPGSLETVRAVLAEAARSLQAKDGKYARFEETPTHFARWVVVDNDPAHAPLLVFTCNHDGDRNTYLDQLLDACPEVYQILQHCEGSPTEKALDKKSAKAFIEANLLKFSAYHTAYHGLSRDSVRNALDVRKKLGTFLDEQDRQGALRNKTKEQVRDMLKGFVLKSKIELLEGAVPEKDITERYYELSWMKKALLWLALLPLIVPIASLLFLPLFIWYLRLRLHERRDGKLYVACHRCNYEPRDDELDRREAFVAQNQMTHCVRVKPSSFRLSAQRLTFQVADFLTRNIYVAGNIATITSVHFAHWILLDDGRRALFFSNFDGGWRNYMSDFCDRAPPSLTLAWTSCQRFPVTRNYVQQGATDTYGFMQFIRESQVPTDVWYSAYPVNSVANILNAIHLREGLRQKKLDGRELDRWLARF